MSAAVALPPRIEVSDTSQKGADYEDDFEEELDSFIATTEEKKTENDNNKENELNSESDSRPEKGSEEIEKGQKEYAGLSGGARDDETDDDDYMFSDDQKTAMRELIAQRQENDFPDEDPPEYDVKDRLILLNAELAKESVPEEREHKVGFKEELVAVFAPPQELSDDEDSQRDKTGHAEVKGHDDVDSARKSPDNPDKSTSDSKKKKVVVERDGKFEVVNIDDLTPTERELYIVPDTDSPTPEPQKMEKNTNNSNLHAQSKQPSPPRQPRPATANGHTSRRQLRPVQNKQRPKSATAKSSQDSSLDNFNYTSPYGLSPKQKELMKEREKALEEKKREEERRKKREKEEEEQSNEEAFQAWLKKKREEDREKKDKEEEEKKKKNKEEKNPTQQECTESDTDSSTRRQRQLQREQEVEVEETAMESFEPLFQKDTEEAYKEWLKSKRAQMKQEKLLKRREEQEMRGCYHTVSRDECEKAFKEWVKKKNVEARKNQTSERQRSRSARAATRRSRKNAALLRAIRNSNSFQYVDYYGYRF